MRRTSVQSFTCLALLGITGALFAYAAPPGFVSSPNLTAVGTVTPRTRAVIADGNAYLLGQPETVVADALVENILVSPTGDAVLVSSYKRRPFRAVALPPDNAEHLLSELNLIYWDVRTRTSKILLREAIRDSTTARILKVEWLPQTNSAFVVLSRTATQGEGAALTEQSVLRVDTTTGTISRLTGLESRIQPGSYSRENLWVSPSRPLAFILAQENTNAKNGPPSRSSLRLYSPQGFRRSIPLPDGIGPLEWTTDGRSVYADRLMERDAEGKLKSRKSLTLVNLETGAVTHPEKLAVADKAEATKQMRSPRENWAIDVATTPAALENPPAKPQTTPALWLRAADMPKSTAIPPAKSAGAAIAIDTLLIAANAHLEQILATESTAAVLFTRDGSLCAAPVFRLPVEAFENALRGVQRTSTMSNAKQVGLAIMMYAQDYDQNFPLPGDGAKDATSPYLKNAAVFNNPGTGENGFVYSYQGPTGIHQVAQPGTTQLGYVSGPGGRAIIWADGHVTWEDTP